MLDFKTDDTFKNGCGWIARPQEEAGSRALGAVLAGLRLLQDHGPGATGSAAHRLATDEGAHNMLDRVELDALAEALNTPETAARLGAAMLENLG
jgi:hypothetical protein